jgi:hypothetical protein
MPANQMIILYPTRMKHTMKYALRDIDEFALHDNNVGHERS